MCASSIPYSGLLVQVNNPCIKLQRALFPLVRILGRLNEVFRKSRSPAWFPVTCQKLPLAPLLQTSVIRSQLWVFWSLVSAEPPSLRPSIKKSQLFFMDDLESLSNPDCICSPFSNWKIHTDIQRQERQGTWVQGTHWCDPWRFFHRCALNKNRVPHVPSTFCDQSGVWIVHIH